MSSKLRYLNLFAGSGGLSEGFIRAGFTPVAHVESDLAACFTLRTRIAWHWLKYQKRGNVYTRYINDKIDRDELYASVPEKYIASVINTEINKKNLTGIFNRIDTFTGRKKIDLIIGGPPCQSYSNIGRSRDRNRMKEDKRNYLYIYYAEFLKRYMPSYFVFENVPGLLSARNKSGKLHFDAMRDLFHKIGYETESMILSANDYGVLQNRKRIILVGKQGKTRDFYPEPDKWHPDVLVSEIFSDLPAIRAGGGNTSSCQIRPYRGKWLYEAGIKNDKIPVTWHQARPNTKQDLNIYKLVVNLWNKQKARLDYNVLPGQLKTHKNRYSFLDRFKVVASDLPFSQTVVAHISKDGHYYIHPDIKQNRSITPREAARLQTFPDDYYFESISGAPARTPAFKQIGNAVPVLLAQKVAEKLMEMW